jgi:hypothetical protein
MPLNFQITVNQLLIATTLFRDLFKVNWLAARNFRDQAFFIHTELCKTIGSQ